MFKKSNNDWIHKNHILAITYYKITVLVLPIFYILKFI